MVTKHTELQQLFGRHRAVIQTTENTLSRLWNPEDFKREPWDGYVHIREALDTLENSAYTYAMAWSGFLLGPKVSTPQSWNNLQETKNNVLDAFIALNALIVAHTPGNAEMDGTGRTLRSEPLKNLEDSSKNNLRYLRDSFTLAENIYKWEQLPEKERCEFEIQFTQRLKLQGRPNQSPPFVESNAEKLMGKTIALIAKLEANAIAQQTKDKCPSPV